MHNVIAAAGADARPAEGLFFGWRVVGAAFVVAIFGWGMCFYGPPVLLYAIHAHRGWPLALISAAVTLHFLLGALVVANLPACYRRWGLPAVTRAGALAGALGMFGWTAADQPWQLFAATLLSGAGWAATGGAAINAMVSPWFARRRPAALSLAYNGASAGGILLSPLWVAAIAWLGLPGAAATLGTIMVVTLWLLAGRYFVHSPAELGLRVDGSGTESATAPTRETATKRSAAPVLARG
jgi:MFS family permease